RRDLLFIRPGGQSREAVVDPDRRQARHRVFLRRSLELDANEPPVRFLRHSQLFQLGAFRQVETAHPEPAEFWQAHTTVGDTDLTPDERESVAAVVPSLELRDARLVWLQRREAGGNASGAASLTARVDALELGLVANIVFQGSVEVLCGHLSAAMRQTG